MASFSHFFLFLTLISSLLSLSQSLLCSSQSFPNRSFTHCNDLPHLNAFLHWTHDPNNSSLSIAFLATPPRSGGWVAWAINPTSTGMAGSQAFLATHSGNTPSVTTLNISSYSSVRPSPLSFSFWNVSAEYANGRLTIFASVKVPPKAESLNQVWQVGPAVDPASGVPAVHDFNPANLNAKSVLVFDKKSGSVSPAPSPHGGAPLAPTPAAVGVNETSSNAPSPPKNGVAGIRRRNSGLVVGCLLFVVWGIINF